MTSCEHQNPEKDNHHIVHHKLEWELRPEGRKLRRDHSLIARIDRDLHKEIHANCPPVPPLGLYVLQKTVRLFEPVRASNLRSVENLQSAIEEAARGSRVHPIERGMAGLSIEALELQKPYLPRGTPTVYFDIGELLQTSTVNA